MAAAVIMEAYNSVVKAFGLNDAAAQERIAKLLLEIAAARPLLDAVELREAALAKIRGEPPGPGK
jgi:hypothetical protein